MLNPAKKCHAEIRRNQKISNLNHSKMNKRDVQDSSSSIQLFISRGRCDIYFYIFRMLSFQLKMVDKDGRRKVWALLLYPFRFLLGFVLLLFTLYILISLLLSLLDSAINSPCNFKCGFILDRPKIFNPLDQSLVLFSRVSSGQGRRCVNLH